MGKKIFQSHVIFQANSYGITFSVSLEHLDRKPVRIMKTYVCCMSGINGNTKEIFTVYVQAIRNAIELFACVFFSFDVDINIKDMKNSCS